MLDAPVLARIGACRTPFREPLEHFCRGHVASGTILLATLAALVGCTTTHFVTRIEQPEMSAEMDAVAPGAETIVHLRPTQGPRPSLIGYRLCEITRAGVVIQPPHGQQLLVAPVQVASLSRYSHARGARDGAMAGGITGFLTGFALGLVVARSAAEACVDACSGPDPAGVGLRVGALLGLLGAALGAGIGAAAGHEDRFVVGSP